MKAAEYLELRKRLTSEYEANLAALERVYGIFSEPDVVNIEPTPIKANKQGNGAALAIPIFPQKAKGNGHKQSVAQRIREAVHYWADGGIFDKNDIASHLALNSHTVGAYLTQMEKKGQVKVISRAKPGSGQRNIYRATAKLKKALA